MKGQRLLERDQALGTLQRTFGDAAEGRGGVVVIDATPGLGKTSLLDAAAEEAAALGLQVLRGRGIEMERHFAFGVARQLLERPVAELAPPDRDDVLAGAARDATSVLAASAPEVPRDEYTVIHGLYWVVANLAGAAPLAILVDDAQWADPATERLLLYLTARAGDLPVALVIATRPRADDAPVTLLASTAGVTHLDLRPLAAESVGTLVRRALPDAADTLAGQIAGLANGNPLVVEQVLATAPRLGIDLGAAGADLDAVLDATVGRRLQILDARRRAVLDALAILGGGGAADVVAAVAAASPAEVRASGRILTDLAFTAPLADGAERLEFVHVAVRDAVLHTIDAGTTEVLHRRAADALRRAGAPAVEIAPHLAAATPSGDDHVVQVLQDAARQALDGGDPSEASRLLGRARFEPPAPARAGAILADLTRATAAGGDPAWRHHLADLRSVLDTDELLPALRRLGRTLLSAGDLAGATKVLQEAVDHPAADAEARLGTLAMLGFAARRDPEVRAEVEIALANVLVDKTTTPAGRALLAVGAYERSRHPTPGRDAVVELATRAVEVPDGADAEITSGPGFLLAAFCLTLCDEWGAADAALTRGVEAAGRRANVVTFAAATTYRARVAFHTGRIDDAIALATAARDAAGSLWGLDLPGTLATLAMALIEHGDLDAAKAALVLPAGPRWEDGPGHDLWATAHCDLLDARGDATAALEPARGIAERRATTADNPSTIRWRSTLARALAGSGVAADREQARRLVDEEIELARAFAAPRALSAALRTRAGLDDDRAQRLVRLQEAEELLAGTGTALERVRVRVALGRDLRLGGRLTDARVPLRAALHDAEAGGARRLADAARAELQATGARPRRSALTGPASLTPSELRTARLAASGLTNREIAERSFVTVKTVEYHLANAYPKLGVPGREGLAAALD